ncbi:transmembrane channel-like protein 6 isoform X2 [Brienomyrus brachyistius]|uniref:transmembrane channel-like protein 6 isoform X2 n=1 Tax=Brienomyrus brachyistius TaxID=42636 RepID=UPI0020B3D546|nr:transmembrane channel-like protein 6 isoform X2 [Brienomyrus brachyistius]
MNSMETLGRVQFDLSPHHMAEPRCTDDEGLPQDLLTPLVEGQMYISDMGGETLEMEDLSLETAGHCQADAPGDPRTRPEEGRGPIRSQGIDGAWQPSSAILSSLPSRAISYNEVAIIADYLGRGMRPHHTRQSLSAARDVSRSCRPSIRGYSIQTNINIRQNEQLVRDLRALPSGDLMRMLRTVPLSMAKKREVRKLSSTQKRAVSSSHVPCCSSLILIKHNWQWALDSSRLWQVAFTDVSGRFGTGVLSYFTFLKTLLFFNVVLLLSTGAFLTVPQAIYAPLPTSGKFTGLEMLTGMGSLANSAMFYSYYTNSTLRESCTLAPSDCGATYKNAPLVYFLNISLSFLLSFIFLVYSMFRSYGGNFDKRKSRCDTAIKTFCSWDFKVTAMDSIQLQSESIYTQLKELLQVVTKETRPGLMRRLAWVIGHLLAWTLCLGSMLYCLRFVYIVMNSQKDIPMGQEAYLLIAPALVSAINMFLPVVFNIVAYLEKYSSPHVCVWVAIFRDLALKVCMLGLLCYVWLGKETRSPPCWESFVGQELYRLLLMDFLITLLDTFFSDFTWRCFLQKVLKRKGALEFNIVRNMLELLYGQALVWLGVLFAPLLPAVQVVKLFLLFYVKKTSLKMNFQLPRRPPNAQHMNTLFISLLCFPFFLGAFMLVRYTMWAIAPSPACGPFRGLPTMAQLGKEWVERQNIKWLSWAYFYSTFIVNNPVSLFLSSGIFFIIIYFHTQVVDGQQKIVSLLQEQIRNEGADKKFLITKLQILHRQKNGRLAKT